MRQLEQLHNYHKTLNNMKLDSDQAITTFFGLFGRPVDTAELLWYQNAFSFERVFLVGPALQKQADFHDEFHHRYRAAVRKWHRAQQVAGWLKKFPWIVGVGIGNTLAYLNVHESSDIDLFVVSKPGRLWLTRFTVTGLLRVLRWRPGEGQQDPVCPSFFVSSDVGSFESIAIEDDVYLKMWLATLVVLWEDGDVFAPMFARNTWAVKREHVAEPFVVGWLTRVFRFCAHVINWNWVERFVKKLQWKMLPNHLKRLAEEESSAVVITDTMLKFHHEDRREQYRDKFKAAYASE